MSNRNLYDEPQRAIAGQKFGTQDVTETYNAGEAIDPGDPCFGMKGDENLVYKAHINAVTLTASADLVAENSLATTVNGVALPAVAFDTDTQKTLGLVVQGINLNDDLSERGINAFVIEGVNAISIEGPGINIDATIEVTGGASQATFASAANTDMVFVGVVRHEELSYREGTGYYPANTEVNVQTRGEIYVPVSDDANPQDKEKAYIILSGANAGKFTDASSGNYDSGCIFRSGEEDGLARVELRGMHFATIV
jgi:hypothetical protein